MTVVSIVLWVVLLLCITVILLLAINAERRWLAFAQGREGPSVAGSFGLLQTALDGLKVFLKTVAFSRGTAKITFFLLPVLLVVLGFFTWTILPLSPNGAVVDFSYDIVLAYFLLSWDVLAFVCAAWSAFGSKFPTLSALREIIQMCAFELVIGFCFLIAAVHAGTLSIHSCVEGQAAIWFGLVAWPYVFLFYLSMLAELHRTPFDLTEAESELTAGYQSEHGGILFSLFFLCEYNGVLLLSTLFSLLLLGGWNGLVWQFLVSTDQLAVVKAVCLFASVLLVRAALPRTRVGAALSASWSSFLPAAINGFLFYLWLLFVSGVLPLAEALGVPARSRCAARAFLQSLLLDVSIWADFTVGHCWDMRRDTSAARRMTPGAPVWPLKIDPTNPKALNLPPVVESPATHGHIELPRELWPVNRRLLSFPYAFAWQYLWGEGPYTVDWSKYHLTPTLIWNLKKAGNVFYDEGTWVRTVSPYDLKPGTFNYFTELPPDDRPRIGVFNPECIFKTDLILEAEKEGVRFGKKPAPAKKKSYDNFSAIEGLFDDELDAAFVYGP
jgi:NADH-quinone oxidoreductase subunit H